MSKINGKGDDRAVDMLFVLSLYSFIIGAMILVSFGLLQFLLPQVKFTYIILSLFIIGEGYGLIASNPMIQLPFAVMCGLALISVGIVKWIGFVKRYTDGKVSEWD